MQRVWKGCTGLLCEIFGSFVINCGSNGVSISSQEPCMAWCFTWWYYHRRWWETSCGNQVSICCMRNDYRAALSNVKSFCLSRENNKLTLKQSFIGYKCSFMSAKMTVLLCHMDTERHRFSIYLWWPCFQYLISYHTISRNSSFHWVY